MATDVTTYYLEMTAQSDLIAKRSARSDLILARIDPPIAELNRFFYTAIGGDWHWFDRLPWTARQWREYVNRPGLETWMLSAAGVPAGYCEMEAQAGGDTEIVYFGVLPRFIGQGLGGHLLTAAVERAWELGSRRVWLHTCTLDHPTALAHYRARGFRIYREETKSKELTPPNPNG